MTVYRSVKQRLCGFFINRGIWLLLGLGCLLAIPGVGCAETVRDEFNQISYANNDGSQNWTNDWQEIGEKDGATGGQVRVMVDGSTSYVLRLQHRRGIERRADLADATAATLNFSYRRSSLDNSSDYVTVEVSGDGGGSWAELDRFSGPNDDSSYRLASYDISAYATAGTRIRFAGSPNMNDNDRVYFDNVEIDYTVTPTAQLVAYYPLEGDVADVSGNGHNGTNQKTVGYGRGKVCDGFVADGGGYLVVPDHPDFDIADELTVMAWLRPDSLSVPGHDRLYSFLSKDTNYEVHVLNNGAIMWWWGGAALRPLLVWCR
ncbi:MAG: hypothetical protein BA869_04525 [Desulfuromonadales bacterium C00003107]|jgi:hypothetical protein|nr:MAG: hypothetical protein BA869_04525 [Desulfuromonadales bacterium C00003107]